MSLFSENSRLDGNWEEPGVIGTRIEISKNRIIILWRSAPVLTTSFRTEKSEDGCTILKLKSCGMRYENAATDYAQVTGLKYKDGNLEFTEFFPITGESRTVLSKTGNSRFGSFNISDDVFLKKLNGKWVSKDGFVELDFKGDTLNINGKKTKIHTLTPYGEEDNTEHCLIVDENPAKDYIDSFSRLEYLSGVITATVFVCDAPSVYITLEKV